MTGSAQLDAERIREEARAEWRARWRYWIGGIPTEDDLTAAWKAVAHRLGVSVEDVRAAVEGLF
jgi:hypothetical protein